MARIEARRRQLVDELSACETHERVLRDQVQESRADAQRLHFLLLFQSHMRMLQAELQWTNDAIEQLTGRGESASVRQAARV